MSNALRKLARGMQNEARRKGEIVTIKLVVPRALRQSLKAAGGAVGMEWRALSTHLLMMGVNAIDQEAQKSKLVQVAQPGSVLDAINEEERKRREGEQKFNR